MGRLLVKLFIRDYANVKNPRVRESYGKLAGGVGIITNLLLCVAKIIIGVLASSIAIIADGVNNLSDTSSSVITLIGFKLSALPEDKDHPYGHARIEYLTGLLISVFIILVGLLLLKSSGEKILHPVTPQFTVITMVVLALSVAIKLWQTFFYRFMGSAIHSLTLKAASTDSRNDVIATSTVLAGVLITRYGGLVVDGYLGALVALFIIWSGIQLIRETTSPLLGEAPDEGTVRDIVAIATARPEVLGIHDLVVHNYGPGKVFASMHIEVDADGDLMESHDMIDNIEREVNQQLHIHFVVHMDPIRKNDPLLLHISTILEEAISQMEGVVNFHDLRFVPGSTHSNIILDVVLSPQCKQKEAHIRASLESALQAHYPSFYMVITFDRAYTEL